MLSEKMSLFQLLISLPVIPTICFPFAFLRKRYLLLLYLRYYLLFYLANLSCVLVKALLQNLFGVWQCVEAVLWHRIQTLLNNFYYVLIALLSVKCCRLSQYPSFPSPFYQVAVVQSCCFGHYQPVRIRKCLGAEVFLPVPSFFV